MLSQALFERPISDKASLFIRQHQHAEPYFALINANREHLRKWLSWVDDIKNPEDILRTINRSLDQFAAGEAVVTGIKCEDQFAGIISLDKIDSHNGTAEIGYWLGKEFEGKGLVTQACSVLLCYAFDELHLNRVQLCISRDNERSKAVARRLRFTYEGTLRQVIRKYDSFKDMEYYSMLKDEWKSIRISIL